MPLTAETGTSSPTAPGSRPRGGPVRSRRGPWPRLLVGVVLLLGVLVHVGVASAGTRPAAVVSPTTLRPPVASTVPVVVAQDAARLPPVPGAPVRPFEAPAHDYGPGHRGVDLATVEGQQVRAPAAGTVTFAGPVAGRGVVVLQHAGGTLTSLEPVEALVPRGTQVAAGSPVAVVSAGPPHAGCPGRCLHWGVRVDGRYVDPWWWLGRTGPVRLLPWLHSPFEQPLGAGVRAVGLESPRGPG